MHLSCAGLAAVGAMLALAACEREAARGAEAAAHAAEQPKPTLAATIPEAAPIPSAQEFVNQASAGDAFEIAAAQVAEQRAQNAAVKAFAQLMMHDHMGSSAELKAALVDSGQVLAGGTGPTSEQQLQLDDLRKAAPQSFDKSYMDGQVRAHQMALELFQTYAQNGQVTALQGFAGKAASVVQHHLQTAQNLDERLP